MLVCIARYPLTSDDEETGMCLLKGERSSPSAAKASVCSICAISLPFEYMHRLRAKHTPMASKGRCPLCTCFFPILLSAIAVPQQWTVVFAVAVQSPLFSAQKQLFVAVIKNIVND